MSRSLQTSAYQQSLVTSAEVCRELETRAMEAGAAREGEPLLGDAQFWRERKRAFREGDKGDYASLRGTWTSIYNTYRLEGPEQAQQRFTILADAAAQALPDHQGTEHWKLWLAELMRRKINYREAPLTIQHSQQELANPEPGTILPVVEGCLRAGTATMTYEGVIGTVDRLFEASVLLCDLLESKRELATAIHAEAARDTRFCSEQVREVEFGTAAAGVAPNSKGEQHQATAECPIPEARSDNASAYSQDTSSSAENLLADQGGSPNESNRIRVPEGGLDLKRQQAHDSASLDDREGGHLVQSMPTLELEPRGLQAHKEVAADEKAPMAAQPKDGHAGTEPQGSQTTIAKKRSRVGDVTLLKKADGSLMESVNFPCADAYLGLTRRRRQQLIKAQPEVVVGKGRARRIKVEFLVSYVPPTSAAEEAKKGETARSEAK